ncbi:hypothetical protein Golax_021835 [Gossypium laxum]|uniref:Uncharacterized protein n=1 Tax=Gossypium laxum TaxID=34288 RepID=A0A7J9AP96_9ROSI|nr:hypothetical protein [Gossypium laxum]
MIVLVGKKMEMRLNILIVMIMAAYLSQKMMTILMFVEEFCTYNPNSASPHFCIGMLFKDATIGDHPKMKVREIERRVASKMHVNVNMTRYRRAKKMVKDKLAINFVLEFAMLWDDAGELRLKNPGSTIKMAMNRVTPKSPPHFKRFYVYFKAMKRGWKEGCKLILGLDVCFKGPFKGELLVAVHRDGNN